MKLAAFLLALAGGVLAFLTVVAVFLVVAEESVSAQLGLAALLALAVIALAGMEFGSSHTRAAGIALIVLSCVALALGVFSAVFQLRPLLVGYGLSLIGGIVALLASGRTPKL